MADIERCKSLRLDASPTAIATLTPCGQIAVRTIIMSCEGGLHINTSRMCMECATAIVENGGVCPVCLLENGRPSRLSALEPE
jgi:hypothetical protein